jgi:hypothetical protein
MYIHMETCNMTSGTSDIDTMNPVSSTCDLFCYIKAKFSFIPGTIDLELVFLNPDKPVRANKRDENNKRQQ